MNSRLRHNRRRAGGGEDRGVGGLILIERMRERHKDRRPADDGELRHGRSAGAADDKMGARDARRQIGEEVGELDRELQRGASGGDAPLVFAARLHRQADARALFDAEQRQRRRDDVGHHPSALRAAGDQRDAGGRRRSPG